MRTRIALVAAVSVAVIIVSSLILAVSVQPAQASTRSIHLHSKPIRTGRSRPRVDRFTSFARPEPARSSARRPESARDLQLAEALRSGRRIGTKQVAPIAPRPAAPADTVTPTERAEWDRVADCEEGGNWRSNGARFSGGLGISRDNWVAFGGLRYAPIAAEATPDQQIMVAERIQQYPPDQYGCRGW